MIQKASFYLKKNGYHELYEKIVQLKMLSPDGKERVADCADAEGISAIALDRKISEKVFLIMLLWLRNRDCLPVRKISFIGGRLWSVYGKLKKTDNILMRGAVRYG